MIILISSLTVILLACVFALFFYCRVRKRFLFAFSLCAALLIFVVLMVTGDITIAYAG